MADELDDMYSKYSDIGSGDYEVPEYQPYQKSTFEKLSPLFGVAGFLADSASGNWRTRDLAGERMMEFFNHLTEQQAKNEALNRQRYLEDYKIARDKKVWDSDMAQKAFDRAVTLKKLQGEALRQDKLNEYYQAQIDNMKNKKQDDVESLKKWYEAKIKEMDYNIKSLTRQQKENELNAEEEKKLKAERKIHDIDTLANQFTTRDDALSAIRMARIEGWVEPGETIPGRSASGKGNRKRMSYSDYKYWLGVIDEIWPEEEQDDQSILDRFSEE